MYLSFYFITGNTTDIYRVDTQYYSSSYYTQYFYMQYSINGADFYNYTDYTGATQVPSILMLPFQNSYVFTVASLANKL